MEKMNSFLTFEIGNEIFAANVRFVHNIIEVPRITVMPETPDYMLGVINLRGKVLPVIDSRIKLGLVPTEFTSRTCIVVMEVNVDNKALFAGFLVDAVSEVLTINEEQINEPPKTMVDKKSSFITGVFPQDDKFIMLIDMDLVFNKKEVVV